MRFCGRELRLYPVLADCQAVKPRAENRALNPENRKPGGTQRAERPEQHQEKHDPTLVIGHSLSSLTTIDCGSSRRVLSSAVCPISKPYVSHISLSNHCTLFCVLPWILRSLFCVLCSLFCVLCSLFSVLCSLFSVLIPVPRSVYRMPTMQAAPPVRRSYSFYRGSD